MKLAFILLGLIQMHPGMSGYEIKTIIQQSTSFFFSAHLSQIYPSLKELAAKGWVVYEVIAQDGRPSLKAYSITEEGSAALEAWLTEPLEPEVTRTSISMYFMKLILMGHLDTDVIVDYIDRGIEAFSNKLEHETKVNLAIERAFIEGAPEPMHSRYVTIWSDELACIRDDLQRRIDELTALREKLLAIE